MRPSTFAAIAILLLAFKTLGSAYHHHLAVARASSAASENPAAPSPLVPAVALTAATVAFVLVRRRRSAADAPSTVAA